ncbi:MAG TPA: hypothetical protein VHN79_10945 [Lacunisphaera sp.]|nr:hypothetical protein [Lacunisphaera sp.]
MTHPARWSVSALLVLAVCCLVLSPPAEAKMSTWKDVQGASFRGEPTEILGPLVVFRTGTSKGRRILLRGFSREDCQRIHAEIAARPPRTDTFAAAKGEATRELVGRVQRVQNRELVPADLAAQPEPALLLVLGGSHNSGDGWFMASNLNQFYGRMQRVYPGLVEGVFLGARHDLNQHRNIAIQSTMPWLVAELHRQAQLSSINQFIPRTEGTSVGLVTRDGVPLVAGQASDAASVQSFVDQVSSLLWLIDPENGAGWADRAHYLNATRPVEFAQSRGEPLLVGNPLRASKLRKYGVKRVTARLAVAADGAVTPTVTSGPADVPPALVPALAAALRQAVVAPAIDHGRPAAGVLDYLLEVPPADPVREAEHEWLGSTTYATLPISEWLVLRPIKVPEQDFESAIIGEKADGTVILNSFEVNTGKISRKAQMSAFNSDWFAEAGADSVRPKAGDRQKIDDETVLTWEKVRSKDGFVDMQTGVPKDYTVGYAWAEFESPREAEAWLGLGSDDGVKIWLNGALVHDKWIRRPSRVDDDVVPLQLKKGANRMLIKIQNATIDWSFIYRLRLKP